MEKRTYDLALLFRRAADVPGKWTAHWLDVDVATQADSLGQAMHLAFEALAIAVGDDIAAGRGIVERRAPSEDWEDYERVLRAGTVADMVALLADDSDIGAVAAKMHIVTTQERPHSRPSPARTALFAAPAAARA